MTKMLLKGIITFIDLILAKAATLVWTRKEIYLEKIFILVVFIYKLKAYNIARALVLSKSYWAIMNKIFMYARPCSIKWRVQWRVQFHFSCKPSVEFSASSFCVSFGNAKIILNNPNPTSSLWLLPGKDVCFNVSIYILSDVLLCSIAEYFYELCRILASP